jgi:hypothetical protein
MGGNRSPHHQSRSPYSGQKGGKMHKKHFTNSEKEAMRVFYVLNELVDKGIIAVEKKFVVFDAFDEMLSGSISSDSRLMQSRQIIFVKKKGRGFPFSVKIMLRSPRQKKTDKQDSFATWEAYHIAIGWLKVDELTEEWVVGAAWSFSWPCSNEEAITKRDWRVFPISLRKFSKSL